MNYILKEISNDLWNKFKSKCALAGKDMKQVLIEMIEKYVSEK